MDQVTCTGYGSCYKCFGGARNLRDANSKCSELEASLVNIETEEENNFLSNVLSQTARSKDVVSKFILPFCLFTHSVSIHLMTIRL